MQTHVPHAPRLLADGGDSVSEFLACSRAASGNGRGHDIAGSWSSGGAVADAITALTVNPAQFGALYDSASGRVGGGTVTGDVYYAFTARSLDRTGAAGYLPTNSVSGSPYRPGTAFAGGPADRRFALS